MASEEIRDRSLLTGRGPYKTVGAESEVLHLQKELGEVVAMLKRVAGGGGLHKWFWDSFNTRALAILKGAIKVSSLGRESRHYRSSTQISLIFSKNEVIPLCFSKISKYAKVTLGTS